MPGPTHEQTLNVSLGEVLNGLRHSWRARAEQTGNVLEGGGRPDILVEDASGWPVVIEAERADHVSAEQDAVARLGRAVMPNRRTIETAIALVYPDELTYLDGRPLREAIDRTDALQYALYTRRADEPPERLPEEGWISGSVRDLAMLVHRAAAPAPRVVALATEFEMGIEQAAGIFKTRQPHGREVGRWVAGVLGQEDDEEGQTRRMAMTVIANALIFHESLAEAGFEVADDSDGRKREVRPVAWFAPGDIFNKEDLRREWQCILEVNYWPIFWSAREILGYMPTATTASVLSPLWGMASRLVAGGVTRSHDLTGIVFQELIADRKFLATYYTRPEAASLLAALALPANAPPAGADWGDRDTLAGVQIGDFACGTGTLLSAAYQRLSLLHELHGGDPRLLHAPMMKHGLVGLDVVNIAVHLTATMLAGSHPGTPFDGECLLTMPYGDRYTRANGNGNGKGNGKPKEAVTVGSLDLLAESVQPSLLGQAAAVTSGGRAPEEVHDLVSRVGHGKFDLVIMNPPFTRPTNHEASHSDVPIPAYAAFETTPAEQAVMSETVRELTRGAPSNDNAGLASHFVELAYRKLRDDGTMAFVLPLSALSGLSWEAIRDRWRSQFSEIIVVTIAGAGSYEASFSADTGMAECLLIARGRSGQGDNDAGAQATFVVLDRFPASTSEAELLASRILEFRAASAGAMDSYEEQTRLYLGSSLYGVLWHVRLPESGPWPLVGLTDTGLAEVAASLSEGRLVQMGQPNTQPVHVPIARVGEIANRGPVHRDIDEDAYDGTPRGPFRRLMPPATAHPAYPMLWAHAARRERQLVVEPDSEGEIKRGMDAKAAAIWATATRAHYSVDLRFNSQSLIVAMTERPCIGGTAWPSVIFENREHEYAFSLWCNSTLGLLMHWWMSNKTQSGRGRTTVTGIPSIPTLDVRMLTPGQHAAAKGVFEEMCERRFLPFDQMDEDPARAELDHRLLVDVLGLPDALCAEQGPIDLLRRKLAREPQIHGGKKSRVVFSKARNFRGNITATEYSERRDDR